MPQQIRKAVFPVAGLGTRFLPATKANPKEMLPIVDKPLIQYAVEEAIAAGINELIFVTSSSKRAIEDHFDSNFELEHTLEQRGQTTLLNIVREVLPTGVSCVYIRQPNPLGLGHAVWCAKNLVGQEPFAVLLADDLLETRNPGCLQQMVACYEDRAASIIALETIPKEDTSRYGIVALTEQQQQIGRIQTIVEKPTPEKAPSNLAVVGRYLLSPLIFDMLEETAADSRGEIQLTDAISRLLAREQVYGYLLASKRYDCGNKLGYLQATVDFALKHTELADEFKQFLQRLVKGFV